MPRDAATIEVRVREIAQLFDSMDPSPFHERDLDRNAEEYIVSSAKELPSGAAPALLVHLDGPLEPGEDGRLVGDAIRVHFARKAELSRRQLSQLLHRGWISLIIGLSVLAAAILGGTSVARSMSESPLRGVLRESLLIGGWVAMWRPIEIFLYDWWGIRGERRVYERLSRMPVRVVPTGARAAERRLAGPARSGSSATSSRKKDPTTPTAGSTPTPSTCASAAALRRAPAPGARRRHARAGPHRGPPRREGPRSGGGARGARSRAQRRR